MAAVRWRPSSADGPPQPLPPPGAGVVMIRGRLFVFSGGGGNDLRVREELDLERGVGEDECVQRGAVLDGSRYEELP